MNNLNKNPSTNNQVLMSPGSTLFDSRMATISSTFRAHFNPNQGQSQDKSIIAGHLDKSSIQGHQKHNPPQQDLRPTMEYIVGGYLDAIDSIPLSSSSLDVDHIAYDENMLLLDNLNTSIPFNSRPGDSSSFLHNLNSSQPNYLDPSPRTFPQDLNQFAHLLPTPSATPARHQSSDSTSYNCHLVQDPLEYQTINQYNQSMQRSGSLSSDASARLSNMDSAVMHSVDPSDQPPSFSHTAPSFTPIDYYPSPQVNGYLYSRMEVQNAQQLAHMYAGGYGLTYGAVQRGFDGPQQFNSPSQGFESPHQSFESPHQVYEHGFDSPHQGFERGFDSSHQGFESPRMPSPQISSSASASASTITTVASHKATPSQPKTFYCEIEGCNKSFTKLILLEKHVHEGAPKPKPFQCTHCPQAFSRSHGNFS